MTMQQVLSCVVLMAFLSSSFSLGPFYECAKGKGDNLWRNKSLHGAHDDEDEEQTVRGSGWIPARRVPSGNPILGAAASSALHEHLFHTPEPTLWDASADGRVANPFDTAHAVGDESEECVIPQEYLRLAERNPVDVVSFLGIKRVEPLRVADTIGKWE